MSDTVLRVRSRLQSLARDNWSVLEDRHGENMTWLRCELAQISRSLEIKARFEQSRPVASTSFFRDQETSFNVDEPICKKQKIEILHNDATSVPVEQKDEKKRGSVCLRARTVSVESVADIGVKQMRKRGRPSSVLLRDPRKLRVVDLRLELKKRGLRTIGLKAVLLNRLLDALEVEQKQDVARLHKVEVVAEEAQEREIVVINDDSDGDEIVRESVESNKSSRSVVTSQLTPPEVVAVDEKETAVSAPMGEDGTRMSLVQASETTLNTGCASQKGEMPFKAELASDMDLPDRQQHLAESDNAQPDDNCKNDGELALTDDAEGLIEAHDVLMTRNSMQFGEKSQLSSPLVWKRKSILRKASSLVPSTHGRVRNVSFAPTNKVDSFQTDLAQPDPSPEKASSSIEPDTQRDESKRTELHVSVKDHTELKTVSTYVAPSPASIPPYEPPIQALFVEDTEKWRKHLSSSHNLPTQAKFIEETEEQRKTRSSSPHDLFAQAIPIEETGEQRKKRSSSLHDLPAQAIPMEETEEQRKKRSSSPHDLFAQAISIEETEKQRKKREFDETVRREAEKLRFAAKLSVQRRLEEAKASKALWAKGDQLKARLRASSAGDKRRSAHTPLFTNEKSASDQVSPPISEPLISTENVLTALDTNRFPALVSKSETSILHTTRAVSEEAKDHDVVQSVIRKQDVSSSSDILLDSDNSWRGFKAPEATHSVVDKHQVVRSMSHRLVDKPAAISVPASKSTPQESFETHVSRLDIDVQQLQRPLVVSSTTPCVTAAKSDPSTMMHTIEQPLSRSGSDSLSSTVSSIPEQVMVDHAIKLGAMTTTDGHRRPIPNLVTGLHSFTTLLEKRNTQESTSVRSAPVINALKLAEKSRVFEEKRRLEKEERKAILKKRMEEHKAALKEKAEKDAQAKRDQERLNVRKKREAELARQRQQKLKEMRAGLERKRAMLAAEKKATYASNAALSSKSTASATLVSHHKHRGLATTSGASQSTTKPLTKSEQKVVLKPVSKAAFNLPTTSKPAPTSMSKKRDTRPPMASPILAKHAVKSHSPDIVNYEMSDNVESSDGGDSGDEDTTRHGKKKVPRWAQKDHLNKILHAQFGKNAIDPSPAIFQDFVDTCNLEAIFETNDSRKKKKFTRRTSSGNWLADRPTAREKALYQRDMGYR